MLKGIIFDLDETIISSKELIIIYFKKLFKEIGVPFPEADKELFYTSAEKGILERFIKDPVLLQKAIKAKPKILQENYVDGLTLKPFARETIEALHPDYQLAIATNRGQTTPDVLEYFEITHFFEVVINAFTLEHPKPHPIVIKHILDTLGLKKEEVLLIGDSIVDIETAHNSDIPVIIIGDNTDGGDYRLPTMQSLPGLIHSIAEKLRD